jgi:predicted Rdx family selenoprotein
VREKLLELYTINIQLIEGRGGVFEITHNTKILFSKSVLGRFPTNQDLEKLNIVADFDI